MRKLLFALPLIGILACPLFLSETSPLVAQSPISPLPTATPYLPGPPPPYYTPSWHNPVTPVSPLPTSPPSPIVTPTQTTPVTVTSFEAANWAVVIGIAVMFGLLGSIVGGMLGRAAMRNVK
jgi:hypothetical protein